MLQEREWFGGDLVEERQSMYGYKYNQPVEQCVVVFVVWLRRSTRVIFNRFYGFEKGK